MYTLFFDDLKTLNLIFDVEDEDSDADGVFDVWEDTNQNGILDAGEDVDGDGCAGDVSGHDNQDGHADKAGACRLAGAPGAHNMFQTQDRTFYLMSMDHRCSCAVHVAGVCTSAANSGPWAACC